MADAFQSLLRLAEMNGGALLLDAGQDEALAVDVATESIVVAGEALERVSHELEQQALLHLDAPGMNGEAEAARVRLNAARATLDATLARVRLEIKLATEDVMRESQSTTTGL